MTINSEFSIQLAEEILLETGRIPFSPSSEYLLAVSGGRDSMLLLYFFTGLAEAGHIKKPVVFHLHHGLRSDADLDMSFVRGISEKYSLQFISVRKNIGNLSRRLGLTLEETGRMYRYRHMKKLCRSRNYDHAVTGHHADDYLESVLIHMIRGGGINSLKAMNRCDVIDGLSIIRPFIALNRERLNFYIDKYDIPFREDESNVSDSFLRNRIRKNVLPILKKEGLDPSHLWKNFHDGFDELWKPFEKKSELDRMLLDRNFFNASSPGIIKNVLDTALKRMSLSPVSLGVLHELSGQLIQKPFRLHLITGRYIIWSAETGWVWIFRKDSTLLKPFRLTNEQDSNACVIHYGGLEKTYLISETDFVTNRKDGMRMDIKKGSKKIKKILQESHIPLEIRDFIPLIVNKNTGRVGRICLSFIEGFKDRVSE